jgi:hypothetical protein
VTHAGPDGTCQKRSFGKPKGESTALPKHLWMAARREQEARELNNPFEDRLLAEIVNR